MELDKAYWNQRYEEGQIGWDLGEISPPIKAWFDQQKNKKQKILLPGAGQAHEAEYAFNQGFLDIYVCDLSELALNRFADRVPHFPKENLLLADFFELDLQVDVILEQTFFCALDPALRERYVQKCSELLNESGTLAGLLFQFPLTHEGPPFGGDHMTYHHLFKQAFQCTNMEPCLTSAAPRMGKELWFVAQK